MPVSSRRACPLPTRGQLGGQEWELAPFEIGDSALGAGQAKRMPVGSKRTPRALRQTVCRWPVRVHAHAHTHVRK